jgi:hypothetical protein
MTAVAVTALALCCAVSSRAANGLASASVNIKPTLETAGIQVATVGDDNGNSTGVVHYRVFGTVDWQRGHPLVRYSSNRLASILMYLREGTSYEALVTMSDPEGSLAPVYVSFTTLETPRSVAKRTLYVTPITAGAAGDGSLALPYRSISAAFGASQPGDTIALLPGVYREQVTNISHSGTPSLPITVRPAAPGVFIRGDAAAPATPHSAPIWNLQADGTWATPLPLPTCYVAANGLRLFHYATQAELAAAASGGGTGWRQDASTRVLYVAAGALSPDRMEIAAGQIQNAFTLMGVHDVILDGLDIGYFGSTFSAGVYLNNSSHVTVRNCRIHNASFPLFVKNQCVNNLFERNEINDSAVDTWDWYAVKGSDAEGIGISLADNCSGNVIRQNHIHNVNDGIAVTAGATDEYGDTDVYYNWIHDVTDDGLEPVNQNINFRAWCNHVKTAQNASSVLNVISGPVWLLFNVLEDFKQGGLKSGVGAVGVVRAYHNTMVTTRPNVDGMTPWTGMPNFTFRNNIVVGTQYALQDYYTTAASNADFDYDLFYTSAAGRWVKWGNERYLSPEELAAATGQEIHGVMGDPLFRGLLQSNFSLNANSPARRRAVIIPGINDFLGIPPDIGAYQMG